MTDSSTDSSHLTMQVEIVLALPQQQYLWQETVASGVTVIDVLKHSRRLSELLVWESMTLHENQLGIWGKLVPAHTLLKPGDRIELYRPLIADPKAARKRKAGAERSKRPDRQAVKRQSQ